MQSYVQTAQLVVHMASLSHNRRMTPSKTHNTTEFKFVPTNKTYRNINNVMIYKLAPYFEILT